MMTKDECLKIEEYKRKVEDDYNSMMAEKEADRKRYDPKKRGRTNFTPKKKKRKKK